MSTATAAPSDSFWLRRIPALDSLRGYTWKTGRSDLIAGLSVASVAVPQAMAYALIAGLPAEYGLYTAIVMTAVGAVFDSSRQLINGPTNAISIALLSAIGAVEAPDQKIQAAILMAFLVGSIQIGIALCRLGDLSRFISHSVIVGFTAGASILLVLDQMKNLFGLKAMGDPHDHFLVRFWLSMTQGGSVSTPTLAVGVGSIVTILALRWFKTRFKLPLLPEFLITVVLAGALSAALGLEGMGVKVVGDIPAKLPSFGVPALSYESIRALSGGAFAVALLGMLEAISMASSIAAVTRQKLDMNQQVLSEGMANFVGSFFGCFPGSGSLTRSAINQQAGAQTQWSGVVSAVAVAVILVAFGPYARFIPKSALAGILMVTASRMVDPKAILHHFRVSRFDAAIVFATAFAAFAVSVEFCVLIGVFLSFVLAVPRTGQMLLTEFVVTPEGVIHERLAGDIVCGRILIFGIEGEMFFGAGTSLERHFAEIESRLTADSKVVVLRMKRARNPDAVTLALLEGFVTRLQERGVRVVLCGVRSDVLGVLERSGVIGRFRKEEIYTEQAVRQTSTQLAVRYASTLVPDPCPTCPKFGEGSLHEAV